MRGLRAENWHPSSVFADTPRVGEQPRSAESKTDNAISHINNEHHFMPLTQVRDAHVHNTVNRTSAASLESDVVRRKRGCSAVTRGAQQSDSLQMAS